MKSQRKNPRLLGYDYSSEGAYFITIVTKDREALFGEIVEGEMVLNALGEVVQFTWNDLVNHNANIGLDEFVIMPNHVHGIIVIFDPSVGAGSKPAQYSDAGSAVCAPLRDFCAKGKPAQYSDAGSGICAPLRDFCAKGKPAQFDEIGVGLEPTPTKNVPLSEIVRQFKTFSAKRINTLRGTTGIPVWQRNYYDHIIGTDREYEQIAEYIAHNPLNWGIDQENQS